MAWEDDDPEQGLAAASTDEDEPQKGAPTAVAASGTGTGDGTLGTPAPGTERAVTGMPSTNDSNDENWQGTVLANGYPQPSSSDAVRTAPTPTTAAPTAAPSPTPQGQKAGTSDDENWQAPTPPTAPSYDPSARNALAARMQTDMQPLNRANYKPSVGRRIVGATAAFLSGFGRNPNAEQIGAGVVDAPYNRALSDQQQRVSADQTALGSYDTQQRQQDENWQRQAQSFNMQDRALTNRAMIDDRRATAQDRQAQTQQRNAAIQPGTEQPDDPQNPMGTWHAMTVGGGKVAMDQPPDWWLKTTKGVKAQREADIAGWAKAGKPLSDEEAKYYRVNGKLKEPGQQTNIRMPSEGEKEYGDWFAAKSKELGRAPNSQEIQAYRDSTHGGTSHPLTAGQADAIERTKSTTIGKAHDRAESLGWSPEATKDYVDAANQAQQDYEDAITRSGGSVQHMEVNPKTLQFEAPQGAPPAQPAQAQPAGAPPPVPAGLGRQTYKTSGGHTLKPGDPVNAQGRSGRFTGRIDQKGKPIINWGA